MGCHAPLQGILPTQGSNPGPPQCRQILYQLSPVRRVHDANARLDEAQAGIKIAQKAGLKPNIQKGKIMASSPITSWQIDGEKMQTVTDFIFLSSEITADGD